jgi:phosphoglycolate phosphatase
LSAGPLRLVIFDVDGTLIDSQAHIYASMQAAFASVELEIPDRATTLGVVGLSLPIAMARLMPTASLSVQNQMVDVYKDAFMTIRLSDQGKAMSPLYPGARDLLEDLSRQDDVLLGIATGKSRRGWDHLQEMHQFGGLFQTIQVADDHPSKPHPSMVETCLRETGVEAQNAVILGDTSFDIDMGVAAGINTIGVAWGYHPVADLAASGATHIVEAFPEVPGVLSQIWSAK